MCLFITIHSDPQLLCIFYYMNYNNRLETEVNKLIASYQELYLNSDNKDYIVTKRLEMVRFAMDKNYKAAARFFNCSKNTVKKWSRRYQKLGNAGLIDISRKPKNSPKRIKQDDINIISETTKDAKYKGKHITVKNIRKKTHIEHYADVTINRYINKATGKTRNKKHKQSNGGSVAWKKKLKPFRLIQIDIKYLTDIHNLKPYFSEEHNNLAKYQITARDVATGASIVAYCDDKSSTYTIIFLEQILYPFLKQFKHLDFKKIKIQTDCGSEFTNKYKKTKGQSPVVHSFTLFIESKFKSHKTNIPGHCTANSDVESFHWSIERDCLGWDDITNNNELIACTTDYIEEYNKTIIVHRGYSPTEKIKETLDVTDITFPKPQILSVKSNQPHG